MILLFIVSGLGLKKDSGSVCLGFSNREARDYSRGRQDQLETPVLSVH